MEWGMVVVFAFVFTISVALSQSSSPQICPTNCDCVGLNTDSIAIDCHGKLSGILPDSWPDSTTELNLADNSLSNVKWSSLSSINKLKNLNMTKNSIDCNCGYYTYWKSNVGPAAAHKVDVAGECDKPPSRQGKKLVVAGSEMESECAQSSSPARVVPSSGTAPAALMGGNTVVSSSTQEPSTTTTLEKVPESVRQGTSVSPTQSPSSSTSASSQAPVVPPLVPALASSTPSRLTVAVETSTPPTTTSPTTTRESVEVNPLIPTPTSTAVVTIAASSAITQPPPPPLASPTTEAAPTTTELSPMTTEALPPTTEVSQTIAEVSPTTAEVLPRITEAPPTTTEEPTTTEITTTKPVLGPPYVSLYTLNLDIKIGSVVHVICQVEGFPKPDVEIIFNGQDAKSLNMFQNVANGAKIVFEAKYTSEVLCYASNKFGRRKDALKVKVKQGSTSHTIITMKLIEEEYTDEYQDSTSSSFQELQGRIKKEFDIVFKSFFGFYGASLIEVRSGSVIVDVLVKSTNSSKDRVMKVVEQELSDAKFGSIPVDRYFYVFKETRACAGEFLNTTWSDMVINGSAVDACPRGAKGFAVRNCTEGGWYYPDYTRCKSDPFTDLKQEMEVVTDGSTEAPGMKILSILQKAKNLTVSHEDYSHMSGDLISCVEILEMLTNYTKYDRNDIAFNNDEAELVVQVTSRLLNRNNEQEFIVAQKLVQTASTLIRVTEQYGLQAAITVYVNGSEELTFFIADNVVMGAGIVEPLKITKDVTFPNFDKPEVDAVRRAWKSTSFLVVDKEEVAKMKVEKIKVAGFLYRTLTRILSAESAYSQIGQGYEINSAVVDVSMEPKLPDKMNKPAIIASNNLESVELDNDPPICAFWDFELNPPNGGWSEKGCWYTHYNTENTTCLCNHMTNFAVLREKPIFFVAQLRGAPVIPPFLLCILIGCIIMICFCGITLFLLLLVAWRMKPDRTWGMHMFVCATLITAFALIIVGLYFYNDVVFCRLLSLLVHYFFLCAFTWKIAEATYMYVWTTTTGPKKRYWIGYFFLGFVPAGIPMAIAWLLRGEYGFESVISCWMSLFPSLFWVFFAPALVFTLIALIIFRQVWKAATGQLRIPLKATYWRTRFRVHVRYCIALLILFLITWLLGILVITFNAAGTISIVLCILFILFCAITGLVILIFYCIMDRQFEDAFRDCFCYCCRHRGDKYTVNKGHELWHDAPMEEQEPIEEMVVPEEEHGVERDPLIVYVTRFGKEAEPSMSSVDDPLYERVRKPEEEPPIRPEVQQKDEDEPEPVYAKVKKDEEDYDDPFPVVTHGSPRFLRGLTRQEVIRMAKKSDADKIELKKYQSPKGSRDDLAEHPMYLLNQQELDEELQHFRTFYAEGKERSPRPSTSTPKTPPGTPTPFPRTHSTASSTTSSKKVVKKKHHKTTSSSSVEKSPSPVKPSFKTFESFESLSTSTKEEHSSFATRTVLPPPRAESTPPPALPPRRGNLMDDDDDDDDDDRREMLRDSERSKKFLDVERDDDSLTDVSAEEIDKDSDEEGGLLDGTRPTAV